MNKLQKTALGAGAFLWSSSLFAHGLELAIRRFVWTPILITLCVVILMHVLVSIFSPSMETISRAGLAATNLLLALVAIASSIVSTALAPTRLVFLLGTSLVPALLATFLSEKILSHEDIPDKCRWAIRIIGLAPYAYISVSLSFFN